MFSLADLVRSTRRTAFVGRAYEQSWVVRWLSEPLHPTMVLAITGGPGAGKSAFLEIAKDLAVSYDCRRLWLDGRLCPLHPAGLWDHFTALMQDTWGQTDIHLLARDGPCVITLDNYDALTSLDEWFRRRLLDWLPADNVLWIMANREHGFDEWARDLGWKGRFQSFRLGPLSSEEVDQFVQQRGIAIPPDMIARTRGWPLALAMLADDHASESQPLSPVAEPESYARLIASRFWEEIHDDIFRCIVMLLSLAPYASQYLIEEVIGQPLSTSMSLQLSRLSFIVDSPLGLTIHDLFKPWLRRDSQRRWPKDYRAIQEKTLHILVRQWQEIGKADKLGQARRMLALVQDMLPSDERYADLTADHGLEGTPFQPTDTMWLHRLVGQWGMQPLPMNDPSMVHQLLDDLIAATPGLFRIFRTPDQRPLAFFVPLLLYDRVTTILERYIGPVNRWLGEETRGREPIDEADTYLGGLIGIDPNYPLIPAHQLIGAIMRDGLSLLAQGMQSFMLLSHPVLISMVRIMGYQPFGKPLSPPHKGQFYVLNLRHRSFAEWIMTVAHITPPPQPLSVKDMHGLLRHLMTPQSKGFQQIAQQTGWNPNSLQATLLDLLGSDPPGFPLSVENQRLLSKVYREKPMTTQRLLDIYHVSRATFYRQLNKAEEALTQALQNRIKSPFD